MDETCTGNNNSTPKLKCLNEQVENPSNQKTTCSEEISSLDELDSNSDAKSSLPTRKQRLKEYLTTTHDPQTDLTLTNEVFEFSVDSIVHPIIHLIGPRLIDNKKPVKVKSRWTRSSQMEFAQENSVPLQTKNTILVKNLSQSSKIINEMAVTPLNIINKHDVNKSIEVKNHNKNIKNGRVVQQTKTCTPPSEVKRKRGRPKKTVIMDNKDILPVVSDIDNQSSVELDSKNHLKPEDTELPKIVKRGRGRPKKNGITSEIVQTPQIVSKKVIPKKKGRKRNVSANVKKHINKVKNDPSNNESNSEDTPLINDSDQYQPEFTLKITSNSSEIDKPITAGDFSKVIQEGNFTVHKSGEIISSELAGFPTMYRIDEFIPPFTPVQSSPLDDTSAQTTNPSNNIIINDYQDMLLELNNINWNLIPKKTRSKSVSEFTKVKQRRNSLSDNFMFNPYDSTKIQNDSIKLKKSWKSLSYIEGGPNIQVERYQRNELDKKFRSELKRSRSFPNCMLLDTVIWRFLVYEQTTDCDESYVELSDTDITLINELSVNEYNREYRSKSVPLEQNEFKRIENTHLHKSLDNLNTLSYTNDLSTFQEPSDICDLKNDESDVEENEGKIRRSKRLNTKVKDSDMLDEYLLESVDSQVDYLLKAEQIRQENERQLSEAQKNDPDLENKLKKLGFKLITNNLFKPSRKEMSEYTPTEAQELRRLKPRRIINTDTYKCHCKYSKTDLKERKPGCGSECLNRLLNIECGAGCSLKSHCTNKQFQNKQFKRTQIIKTPDKGYGVFALEDIPSGTFVDEYMGEVIDQHEMIKRMKKKLYRNNNYMVQLKHDEIIDATRKGNITRFINHSCEPNCVAEKWNVLGESRMGFFSKVLIAKGEEITFDYSFEIFGDAAQQKCYCGAPKCRGYISKKSRTGDPSSSDESDDNEGIVTTKTDEPVKKKKLSMVKKITNKDKKRLRELDQQLTDISKLKNKNRSDLESSTLNLNKLMVHITDSMSRSHILKFIRENDLNCKRLFMNFNGLSIIHSWMISNNSESLKLEIIKTLSELPISNRNTITKSKVIDIVAEWANIPKNIKEVIENLEYPDTKTEDHEREVDKLLPHINNISCLVKAARELWKKWIILKMVFKIPKLDRPKEVNISDIACRPSRVFSQSIPISDEYNLIKPTTFCQNTKNIPEKPKIKINHVKYLSSQSTPECTKVNSIDNFSKIINHQNQINNRDKNKAVLEWNKKREHSSVKKIQVNSAFSNNSNHSVLKSKHGSISTFKSECMVQEIPTIESCASSNKIKWSNTIELTPTIYEVPTDYNVPISTDNIFDTEINEFYPIEEITTSQPWLPPKIGELQDLSTLEHILKMPPPCINTSWCIMKPENVFYDAGHPSIEEQNAFIPIEEAPVKNTSEIQNQKSDSDVNIEDTYINAQQVLFQQCKDNLKNLIDKGLLNPLKSPRKNFIDRSPMKISESFFQKNPSKLNVKFTNELLSSNLFKCLKIKSNFYQEQPSNIIKIHHFQSKNNTMKSKNNVFRIKEKKSVKSDLSSVALKLCNKQLTTAPQDMNLRKIFKKHSIKLKTENKFACKIFSGLLKRCHNVTNSEFILKLPSYTENTILDPLKENELHQKLIPTVKNTLCAKLIKGENDSLNVFKQKLVMTYDESKSVISMGSILKQNQILSKTVEKNSGFRVKHLKRKLIWPPQIDTKKRKLDIPSVKNICDSRNQVKINQMDDDAIFKKPMVPPLNKKIYIRTNTTHSSQGQRLSISKSKINEMDMRQKAGSSNLCAFQSKSNADNIRQKACTSNQSTSDITLSKTNTNEIRQKPLMKCSPFNKVDNFTVDLEQNVKNLATNLSMDSSIDISPSSESSSEQIESIVANFKSTISLKKIMGRANLVDDPIVRDYIQRTQLKSLDSKRKYKLPESMLSLPVEVLNLVPDNQKEIKYVVDFYHAMATVIVKVLDSYVKKSCRQGRIKNDEDFKYLAKKLNSNILFKELQVKKVEDLKISDSVKLKVEQYIKKYMLKYGKVYRRKNSDQ